VTPGEHRPGALTTPDPVTLHHDLAELARQGIEHVAVEASSHGLDQFRLDGLSVTAAAFTNLTRDHLDYHGDLVLIAPQRIAFSTPCSFPAGRPSSTGTATSFPASMPFAAVLVIR